MSNDRVVSGEGQETILLNEKGHTRAIQQGNEGMNPSSRGLALVLPKP